MTTMISRMRMALFAAAICAATPAAAEELMITQYGVAAGGYPYAVALRAGLFKKHGLDITGIISAKGGGEAIRNMLASGVAYGEANPGAVVAAAQQGVPVLIIADTMTSVGDLKWISMPNSKFKSIADLKGARLGYTNPKSTTQALDLGLIDAAGLTEKDVSLVKTGGFGEGLAALESGVVDVVPLGEPLYTLNQDKYHKVAQASEVLPLLNNVVAITTKDLGEKNRDFIQKVLAARREAVELIYSDPNKAAEMIAAEYKQDVGATTEALNRLIETVTRGVNYIGTGEFHLSGLKDMLELQRRVGAIEGDYDINALIDTSYLPEDLQKIQ